MVAVIMSDIAAILGAETQILMTMKILFRKFSVTLAPRVQSRRPQYVPKYNA
jgi:hypothetical protein